MFYRKYSYRLIILKIIKILSNIGLYYADKYLKIVNEICKIMKKNIIFFIIILVETNYYEKLLLYEKKFSK